MCSILVLDVCLRTIGKCCGRVSVLGCVTSNYSVMEIPHALSNYFGVRVTNRDFSGHTLGSTGFCWSKSPFACNKLFKWWVVKSVNLLVVGYVPTNMMKWVKVIVQVCLVVMRGVVVCFADRIMAPTPILIHDD